MTEHPENADVEPEGAGSEAGRDEPEITRDPATGPGPPENPEVDDEKLDESLDDASKELR